MSAAPFIHIAGETAAAKLDAIKHVTWICESLRYLGWAALLAGAGVFLRGLAACLAALRFRR